MIIRRIIMTNTIQLSTNKVLKLTNVLIQEMPIQESDQFTAIVYKMENYIKSKGAMPVGPLIQKTSYTVTEDGQLDVHIYLMRQANNFIHSVEKPYSMESVIRVCNCAYVRYTGPEEKLKFAYDKINLAAFENDFELSNENYTIFVDQQDDIIIADVFAEMKSDE